ncbi:MAG: outer membrane beta-barrel protein [Saprospiraceae bacterium]|nr:outer membrane beta-barrel protein [Saprospiraceae bacterium]
MRWYSTLFFFLSCVSVFGQVSFGVTGGLSTSDLDKDAARVVFNDVEQFKISATEARYGIHAGVFSIIQMEKFYLMPEVIFNSNKVEYEITELDQAGEVFQIYRQEELQKLDLGLMMGMKLGALRAGIGPVGHVHIDNVSQLWDVEGYDQNFQGLTWGWQGGLGLDLWFLHFDVRYEGNLSQFGDHITFFGEKFHFDKRIHRWIARVGVSF